MSLSIDDKERLILPRWLPFKTAATIGEIQSDHKFSLSKDAIYKQKEQDWLLYKELPYAVDLVGSAIMLDDLENPIAREAALFIIGNSGRNKTLADDMARSFLGYSKEIIDSAFFHVDGFRQKAHRKIAAIRMMLIDYPRSPILWCDLAFYYALVGQNIKSERCMNVALSLSKDNRFILRAAARCFIHVKEPDKALYYLHKTSLSQHDPWLLATEISVGEALQKRSRNIKRGVQLLSGQSFSPRALSELAGAIGTIEFKSGALKASRKLFNQSLVDPTENTAAQAEWISGRIGTEFVIERDKIPALFEANSRHYMKLGDHKKSYEQAVIWFEFQPFSSRPACFGSYVASVCLHDHQKALDIIEMAPPSSFGNITLQNNHAFALASLDRTTEALHVLQQIDTENLPEEDKYTLLATYGTICFRSDKLADGRESYEKAVKEFKKMGLRNKAAAALLFWGREEQRTLNNAGSARLLKEALDISKEVGPPEITSYAETLLIRVDPVGPPPSVHSFS